MEEGACLGMKDIGKPCTGKLYARFDEGGLVLPALYSTLNFFKKLLNPVLVYGDGHIPKHSRVCE